jgi:hypothetical protein
MIILDKRPALAKEKARKFFFEKKNQKTFDSFVQSVPIRSSKTQIFLLLFQKRSGFLFAQKIPTGIPQGHANAPSPVHTCRDSP